MTLAQARPEVTTGATRTFTPVSKPTLAPAPTAVLQRRCGGDCGCDSCKGAAEPAEDMLAPLLRQAVEGRTLQREPQLQAPGGLLQRECAPARLHALERQKRQACNGISCRGIFDCGDIDRRWRKGNECWNLRNTIMTECYGDNEPGHAEQLDTVSNAIDACDRKWRSQRCG